MTQDELVEIIARAQYAANCWWRPVEDDDDALGRYKAGHGPDRFRAIEWEQLGDEERKELLDAAQAAIDALSSKGLAVVPVEPTEAMQDAGGSSIIRPSIYMGGTPPGAKRRACDVWADMLAARPKEGA